MIDMNDEVERTPGLAAQLVRAEPREGSEAIESGGNLLEGMSVKRRGPTPVPRREGRE